MHAEEDPYHDLYEDIARHSTTSEVLSMGDFNAWTSTLWVPLYDIIEGDMQNHSLYLDELEFVRSSIDT